MKRKNYFAYKLYRNRLENIHYNLQEKSSDDIFDINEYNNTLHT